MVDSEVEPGKGGADAEGEDEEEVEGKVGAEAALEAEVVGLA